MTGYIVGVVIVAIIATVIVGGILIFLKPSMKTCETCGRSCNFLFRHRTTINGKRVSVEVCSRCDQKINARKRPK